jgi:hypothetical protein
VHRAAPCRNVPVTSTLGLMFDDTAAVIAFLSALVAMLSALYARWQARAADKSNQIALHADRLDVYKGLVRFRAYITARGVSIKDDEVWKFAEAAELSEFYFPAAVHKRMDSVFQRAIELLSLNDQWETNKPLDRDEMIKLNRKRQDLMKEIREDCYAISDEFKPHLRVGET